MDQSLILRKAFVDEVSTKADIYLFSQSPTFKQFIDAYFFAYTEKGGVQLGLDAPDIAIHFVEEMDNILKLLNEDKGNKLTGEQLIYLRDAAVSFLDNEASVRFILKCVQTMYRNRTTRGYQEAHKVPVLQTGVPNRNDRIYELGNIN